jgi:hypothetical protein
MIGLGILKRILKKGLIMIGRIAKMVEKEIAQLENGTKSEKAIPRLLTVPDVAEILSCSPHQVYRYLEQGVLKGCVVRIAKRTIRFHPDRLRNAINSCNLADNCQQNGVTLA